MIVILEKEDFTKDGRPNKFSFEAMTKSSMAFRERTEDLTFDVLKCRHANLRGHRCMDLHGLVIEHLQHKEQ